MSWIGSLFACCGQSSVPFEPAALPNEAAPTKVNEVAVPILLGKGATGNVYATVNPKTGSPEAVKVTTSPRHFAELEREFDLLKALNGVVRHTMQVKRFSPRRDSVSLYMQRLPAPDLVATACQDNQSVTSHDLFTIAQKGLEAFHDYRTMGVIHSDIKPDNLSYCFKTQELVVFDFGYAVKPAEGETPKGGSFQYCAPERLCLNHMSYEIDIWAFGATLFEIYTSHYLLFDPGAFTPTVTQIMCLLGEQFQDPLFTYLAETPTGRHHLNAMPLASLARINSWYRTPWQDRIRQAAEEKGEPQAADKIIILLTRLLTIDPKDRITPEQGLDLLKSFFEPAG